MRLGNREFMRYDTGDARRWDLVRVGNGVGVVVMRNLVQVYGPARVNTSMVMDQDARKLERERMATEARRRRLPKALRYDRDMDPRFMEDWPDEGP